MFFFSYNNNNNKRRKVPKTTTDMKPKSNENYMKNIMNLPHIYQKIRRNPYITASVYFYNIESTAFDV